MRLKDEFASHFTIDWTKDLQTGQTNGNHTFRLLVNLVTNTMLRFLPGYDIWFLEQFAIKLVANWAHKHQLAPKALKITNIIPSGHLDDQLWLGGRWWQFTACANQTRSVGFELTGSTGRQVLVEELAQILQVSFGNNSSQSNLRQLAAMVVIEAMIKHDLTPAKIIIVSWRRRELAKATGVISWKGQLLDFTIKRL